MIEIFFLSQVLKRHLLLSKSGFVWWGANFTTNYTQCYNFCWIQEKFNTAKSFQKETDNATRRLVHQLFSNSKAAKPPTVIKTEPAPCKWRHASPPSSPPYAPPPTSSTAPSPASAAAGPCSRCPACPPPPPPPPRRLPRPAARSLWRRRIRMVRGGRPSPRTSSPALIGASVGLR
jgi:hypothetical protein